MSRTVTEQFTGAARQAVVAAQEHARALGHAAVDAEHVLIGVAATSRVLEAVGADLAAITGAVERALPMREEEPPERLPLTPAAKRVLDRALRHHERLGHPAITTGHLLLGLLEEPKVVVVLEEVVGDVFGLAGAAERAAAEEGAGSGSAAAAAELQEAGAGPDAERFRAPVEPVCPACRVAVADTARTTLLDRPGWTARLLFCGGCGTVLGTAQSEA
jgi:ATP-dependent Clp protease ATP-binding subunit ClpA